MGRARRIVGKAARGVGLAIAAAAVSLLALDLAFPPPLEAARETGSLIYDREGRLLHAMPATGGVWRFAAQLDDVDPVFLARLIEVEDRRFYAHPGVDLAAVTRAAIAAAKAGRIVSGASTITMQTARLLEPRPRTFWAKAIESFRALQIERRLSKAEILSLYLTRTPYGGAIEGVRAASLIYFGKEPARLTDAEQALLLALPQAPEARRPDRRPDGAVAGMAAIASRLVAPRAAPPMRLGPEAAAPVRKRSLPRLAYHGALAARHEASEGSGDVRTSLDVALQTAFESSLSSKTRVAPDGATAAAIAVDASTGEILAYVGSGGFDAPGGWIDLARAVRSPGSTLKPFVYGMAFDDGTLRPDTVMRDTPKSIDGYAPENFDRRFRGEVRVQDALRHSLNVPAVEALHAVGARRFGASLRDAGAPLRLPARGQGEGASLPTALGGAGLRLLDLAALYAGLENGGSVRPLTLLAVAGDDAPVPRADHSHRLMSEESAARITAILRSTPTLEGRAPAALVRGAPAIAYKTGTSYGYRDAFAVGSAGGLTIAAWVGRADGGARPGRTGRREAAPLLFELFDVAARHGHVNEAAADADEPVSMSEWAADGPARAGGGTDLRRSLQKLAIAHPADGADLLVEARGVRLAADGGAGAIVWYVDGERLEPAPGGGGVLWRPHTNGFYTLTAVDETGASAVAHARVSLVGGKAGGGASSGGK